MEKEPKTVDDVLTIAFQCINKLAEANQNLLAVVRRQGGELLELQNQVVELKGKVDDHDAIVQRFKPFKVIK